MNSEELDLLDAVALLRDENGSRLRRGDVGTVVEILEGNAYEVEFVEEDGSTVDVLTLSSEDFVPVRLGPMSKPVTGVIDDAIWYWYDPESDVLDMRVNSKRHVDTSGGLDEQGMYVLRAKEDDTPVGMIVRGFWERFGEPGRDVERDDLERRAKALTDQLAA